MNYPTKYRISSGKGQSSYALVAFDNALIDAGISNYNLLKVSSILPVSCQRAESLDIKQGAPLMTAYAAISSSNQGKKLATAVAVGIPKDKTQIGLIMEYKAEGISAEEADNVARNMVVESMNNHEIMIDHIESSAVDGIVGKDTLSLISAIAMW